MPFVADSVTLQDIADTLQVGVTGNLASFWTTTNARQHARAYTEIVMRLLARGYTLNQVNTWGADALGQGQALERDLSLFFSLTNGQSLAQVDLSQTAKAFDRRQELTDVQLVIGGVFVYPDSTPGTVGTGGYDTSTDVFVPEPFTDGTPPDVGPGYGLPTHW